MDVTADTILHMQKTTSRMPRPLTEAERTRIEAARRRIAKLQRELEAATLERDLAILDAFNGRAQVTEIASAAGISRKTVYQALERLEKRDQ
jgi:uncharacterized membrane protein